MRNSRTKLLPRATNVRDAWLCVIATEGRKTEARYFTLFQSSRVEVVVFPTGEDNQSSPRHVLNRLGVYREQYDFGPQDRLWLMIDVDRWTTQNLAEVCREAKQRSIGLAVSNPCFELWLWLHHADVETIDRDCKAIETRLRQHLGSYNKANLDTAKFKPSIQEAIRRAQNMDTDADALWPAHPGTHVYKVVASLPIG